ncbi:GAF domain-containing sensor histidine kinase [Palleronia sp. LCG004]|uniref:GAF domain-containing sensor histidine kinase n=1 Tax=Palleronia sp. LCG004 TaxID=3079304 RepID=UPI0029421C6A|nr:GAF domain-containing sensor histidine kinase [Palleronia sp. LCG004]WOI56129.1 GAF domain-containing sensor histidine kinase [Palleronia sp. LCG004]
MDTDHSFIREIADIQAVEQVSPILDVCTRVTGMRFAAVTCITGDQWTVCDVVDHLGLGLEPGAVLDLDETFCKAVRETGAPVTIDDAERDPSLRDHAVYRRFGARSHIAVPIVRADGTLFGTLCALDPDPKELSQSGIVAMFELFSRMIANALDANDHLRDEQNSAALREEFIGVVGHDLRNPISALSAGLRMIERTGTADPGLTAEMRRAIDRSFTIIDNLLDLTRGRLGNGIDAELKPVDLAQIVSDVAGELRIAGEVEIRLDLDLPPLVVCDPQRLGQLVSNLISNAVDHRDPGTPIHVEAQQVRNHIRLSVTNHGRPIRREERFKLFLPFQRGENGAQGGLGLGLYIASEIAKAHRGRIAVRSDDGTTTFTLTMPAELG